MFNGDLFGVPEKQARAPMLPALFRPRKGALVERLDPKFEAFYRSQLRGVRRHRVRSTALHARLVAWADANDLPSLGFRAIRSEMEAIGHRRLLSNGVWFDDVAFAEDVPEIGDTLPTLPAGERRRPSLVRPADAAVTIERIDAALAELLAIRRSVQAMQDVTAPAEAAARIVGADR
jgi:hypothetical protein